MSLSVVSAIKPTSPSVLGVGVARPAYFKNLSNAGIAALSASQTKVFDPQPLAAGLVNKRNSKRVSSYDCLPYAAPTSNLLAQCDSKKIE